MNKYTVIGDGYALSGFGLHRKATVECKTITEVLTIFFEKHWTWDIAPTILTIITKEDPKWNHLQEQST